MPFEYPLASKSILEGNEFYRITRSSYEGDSETVFGSFIGIDVGFNAITVGPDSDFDNYVIYYPDPLSPGGIAQANFSTGAPFIGAISPDASGVYEGTFGVPKIAYVRPTQAMILAPPDLGGDFALPVMDIIAYTGKIPPVLPSERSVKKIQGYFKTAPAATGRGHAIVGFGRKSFTANVVNNSAGTIDVLIYGVMLGNGPLDSGDVIGYAEKHPLLASTAVLTGDSLSFAHDSRIDGYFDYFLLEASGVATSLPSDGPATAVYISMEVQD